MIQADALHVVQGELAQVYLSVLSIAQLHSVVEHTHVVGAHAAHVYCLQTAYAAVVLQLHTREIADGVGY